ncbi:MAG: hypothetical protein AMXMBFR64_27640 [Myxococcales bacterium]
MTERGGASGGGGPNDAEPLGLDFGVSSVADDPVLARALVPLPQLLAPPVRSDVLSIACRGWEDRIRSEYVGVMIVRRLHGLLVDLNAPMDLQEAALRMLLDEQRHAALCTVAAQALGSDGVVAFDLPELQQARTAAPLEHQLLEMLVGTYACGEVVAHALIRHAVKALPPSGFRDILRTIARDEVLHARIGPIVLRAIRSGAEDAWIAWPGDREVRALFERQREAMRGRAVVEPDEEALFADPTAAEQLRTLGIPPSGPFRAAYLRAVERDIARSMRSVGVGPDRTLTAQGSSA